jgi:hypothetical protein
MSTQGATSRLKSRRLSCWYLPIEARAGTLALQILSTPLDRSCVRLDRNP